MYTEIAEGFSGHLDYNSWHVSELEDNLQQDLRRRFGERPDSTEDSRCTREIEEVRSLTEWERCIFSGQHFVSPRYMVQVLYKVKGQLSRDALRCTLHGLLDYTPDLRANYITLGIDSHVYKVIFKEKLPDVRFQNLKNLAIGKIEAALSVLMAEDRKRGIDLAKDSLMRMTVVQTDDYEYAVFVTQLRMLADTWDVREVFAEVTGSQAEFCKHVQENNCREKQETAIPPAVFRYWENLLKDLPPIPRLPGFTVYPNRKKQERSRLIFDRDTNLLLRQRTQNHQGMMIAMLHTAWGILQQVANYQRDTYYCVILSSSRATMENASQTAGSLQSVPVRLKVSEEQTVQELVSRQFRQMFVSQSVSCMRMQDLLEMLQKSREIFPYLLYFHGFFLDKKSYRSQVAFPFGVSNDMVSWNPDPEHLAIYFQKGVQDVFVDFVYNPYCFSSGQTSYLEKALLITVQQMLLWWEESIGYLMQALKLGLGDLMREDATYMM